MIARQKGEIRELRYEVEAIRSELVVLKEQAQTMREVLMGVLKLLREEESEDDR